MRKKSLIVMLSSVSLVAVVGVGSTLAYLSSQTGTLMNTFTASNGYNEHNSVQIQETAIINDGTAADGYMKTYSAAPVMYGETYDYTSETASGVTTTEKTFQGNDYQHLLPGDTMTKDPSIVLKQDSINSYVILQILGATKMEKSHYTINGWHIADQAAPSANGTWIKILNIDYSTPLNKDHDGYYAYVMPDGTYEVTPGTKTADIFESITLNSDVTTVPEKDDEHLMLLGGAVQYKNVVNSDNKPDPLTALLTVIGAGSNASSKTSVK